MLRECPRMVSDLGGKSYLSPVTGRISRDYRGWLMSPRIVHGTISYRKVKIQNLEDGWEGWWKTYIMRLVETCLVKLRQCENKYDKTERLYIKETNKTTCYKRLDENRGWVRLNYRESRSSSVLKFEMRQCCV